MMLCLYGAGGHGRVFASQLGRISEAGFVFGDFRLKSQVIDGTKVAFATVSEAIGASSNIEICITIGDNGLRCRLQKEAGRRVAQPILVDPRNVFTDDIGFGSQVLAGSIVNVGARIGLGVIVNSNATIEHDCSIGDFCHVAPGAVICGGAIIGEQVLLGAGSVVLPGVRIASGAVVGSGAVVHQDILEPGTWVGVPARKLHGSKA